VLLGFLRGDPSPLLSNHDSQFRFLLHACGLGRDDDLISGTDHRGGWLEEEDGDLGDLSVMFCGVGSVIAGYADDFAGQDGRQKAHVFQGDIRFLALKSPKGGALKGTYVVVQKPPGLGFAVIYLVAEQAHKGLLVWIAYAESVTQEGWLGGRKGTFIEVGVRERPSPSKKLQRGL
jgi:hypothetical protein